MKVEIVTMVGNFSFQEAVNERLKAIKELGFAIKDIKYSTTSIGHGFDRIEHSAMIVYDVN